MDMETKLRRAAAYKSIHENEFYGDAVERIRAKLLEEFEHSKPSDAVLRERIHLSLSLLKTLHSTITTTIESGEVDRKQIADMIGKTKGVRDFFPV